MVLVNTLKNETVSEYLTQYSGGTKRIYQSVLRAFFGMVYPELLQIKDTEEYVTSLDKLSAEYVADLDQDFQKDILNYKEKIRDKAPKTRGLYFSVIFNYLESNNLEFQKRWKKNILGKGSDEAISEEKVPTPDELKRIISHLSLPARAYVYIMATGGLRPGEGLRLDLSDLLLDYVAKFPGEDGKVKEVQIPKINIRHKNSKTKVKRFTFITQEAKRELESFIDYRDEYIERLKHRGGRPEFFEKLESGRLIPFSTPTFIGMWETALKKAGLYARDPETNRITLRPHNLRKFFETWGNWSNPSVPECLVGHIEGMRKIYQRMDQAERLLVEGYKEAEPNLTLFDAVEIEAPSEEVKELKDRLTQNRLEILEGKDERRRLIDKVAKQERLLQLVIERMTWLEEETTEEGAWVEEEDGKIRFKFTEELE